MEMDFRDFKGLLQGAYAVGFGVIQNKKYIEFGGCRA